MIIYRIKSTRTGMYYNKRGWVRNSLYNKEILTFPNEKDQIDSYDLLEEDDYEGHKNHAEKYNRSYFNPRFSPLGDIFYSRRGAEQVLTSLTKTNKKTRSTKAGLILHGTEKASYYKIVKCKLVDIDET